jgi:hypothetical protein
MEPKPTPLEQIDERISALHAAFVRAHETFQTLREGGIGPTFHPEDEGPITP